MGAAHTSFTGSSGLKARGGRVTAMTKQLDLDRAAITAAHWIRRLNQASPTLNPQHLQRRKQMTTNTQIQTGPDGTWAADKVHSTVWFAVNYLAGTLQGSFADVDAEYRDGVLSGAARVASAQVHPPHLGAHLLSPGFFDAGRYPEITFRSNDIRREGDRLTIDGELTVKGHTEPVEIIGAITDPIDDASAGQRIGIKLETKVDRKKFGINWNNPLPSGDPSLANEVTLIGDLELSKQA
jgi:polyisoprenoid-binding protein YceI